MSPARFHGSVEASLGLRDASRGIPLAMQAGAGAHAKVSAELKVDPELTMIVPTPYPIEVGAYPLLFTAPS